MTAPAFQIGELVNLLAQYLADVNTIPISLACMPSVAVPCGSAYGLPIGMQIIGGFFDEPKILSVAAAVGGLNLQVQMERVVELIKHYRICEWDL